MTARERRLRYSRKIKYYVRKNRQLIEDGTAEALSFVQRFKSQILEEIVGIKAFELRHLRVLRKELDKLAQEFSEKLSRELGKSTDEVWKLASERAESSFAAAGIELKLPMIPKEKLAVIKDYTADLITRVSKDTIADISASLRLSMLRGESIFRATKRIEEILSTRKEGTGLFWRAERIARTELGRAASIASQETYLDAQEKFPDLKKEWITAGDAKVRESHVEAGRKYGVGGRPGPIPVDEAYTVGGAKLMFPGDPAGPPEEVINCRCDSIPYRESWK